MAINASLRFLCSSAQIVPRVAVHGFGACICDFWSYIELIFYRENTENLEVVSYDRLRGVAVDGTARI